jgi:pilus assembly protein Flp/PilA
MNSLFRRFIEDQSAASAIEYGLLATFIALGLIPIVQGIGQRLGLTFAAIRAALS